MDPAGPRGPRLRRRRVRLPDLRGYAHHAGPVSPPCRRPHRPRCRRPDCGAVLTDSEGDQGSNPDSLLDHPVREFLDRVAARVPAPGGGGASAVTAALAAGLVAMAARFSAAQLPAAGNIAEQADRLRHRVAGLADEDATAYQAVLDAFAQPRDAAGRRARIRDTLHGAATIPLEIAEIAAQVGQLATDVAGGNPSLRGDALTAAYLAEAAVRSAAALVDINVRLGSLPADLSQRAARAVDAAQAAAARAANQEAGEQ